MAGCDYPLRTQLRNLAFAHATAERIRSAAGRVVADPLSEDAATALVPLLLVEAELARAVLAQDKPATDPDPSVGETFEVGA